MTPQKKMPNWLRQVIETKNPTAFGKFARFETCGWCGAIIISGWDAYDDYAGKYRLDPAGLDTLTELAAIMTGRLTFELRTTHEGMTISRRDSHRIEARRPETHDWPVLPEHRCQKPLGRPLDRRKLSGK